MRRETIEGGVTNLSTDPNRRTAPLEGRARLRLLWPAGTGGPADVTLWRWLGRAVAGNLLRDGTGHRSESYRYWLPAREAE